MLTHVCVCVFGTEKLIGVEATSASIVIEMIHSVFSSEAQQWAVQEDAVLTCQ